MNCSNAQMLKRSNLLVHQEPRDASWAPRSQRSFVQEPNKKVGSNGEFARLAHDNHAPRRPLEILIDSRTEMCEL